MRLRCYNFAVASLSFHSGLSRGFPQRFCVFYIFSSLRVFDTCNSFMCSKQISCAGLPFKIYKPDQNSSEKKTKFFTFYTCQSIRNKFNYFFGFSGISWCYFLLVMLLEVKHSRNGVLMNSNFRNL